MALIIRPKNQPMVRVDCHAFLLFEFVNRLKFQNLELFRSAGRLHFYHIAHLFAEQRSADRGTGGNLPVWGVRFFAGDEIVSNFLVLPLYPEPADLRAQPTAITGDFRHVDHGEIGQTLLQLAQPGINESLTFFGGVVLGIFAQVPMRAGLQNLSRQLVAQLVFECGDFFFQFLLDIEHGTSD